MNWEIAVGTFYMSANSHAIKLTPLDHQHKDDMLRWTLTVLCGKWRTLIICELIPGTKRFGELHRSLDGITQRVLTLELRHLQKDGIVMRTMYPTIPPKVEYSLTESGRTLQSVFVAMEIWAKCSSVYRKV